MSKLLLKHMTLQFLDIILTTRITCVCGDHDHITNLTLTNSTEVIILVLLVRDRAQSILQVFYIQMTQVRLEKNLDLNNNISSVPLHFAILSEDTKKIIQIGVNFQN